MIIAKEHAVIALGQRKLIMIREGHMTDIWASNNAPALDLGGNYIVISLYNYSLNYIYSLMQFSARMYVSHIK